MPPIAKCDPVTLVPAAGEAAGPPIAIGRSIGPSMFLRGIAGGPAAIHSRFGP